MAIFKVVFLKNEILACHELSAPPHESGERMECQQDKSGRLIYAMIPADSEREAHLKALELIRDVTRKGPRSQ